MTWHSCTVADGDIARLIEQIRREGGVVTSCSRCPDGVCVTWTTRDAG